MSKKYKTFPAKPYPLGVRREGKDILVSMISDVEDCGVLLFNSKEKEQSGEESLKIPFHEGCRTGRVYAMKVEGVPARFDAYQLYQAEKAYADFHGTCYKAYPYGKEMDASQMKGTFVDLEFDWEMDRKPTLKFSDSVFYGLHVRGFTMGADSKCRHKGTFTGVQEKLVYLKELGITSIILMPAYEFIEKEKLKRTNKTAVLNYWGYKPAYYYAPKASYASSKNPCAEFKQLVKACHEKGMELFMQFYFPMEMSDEETVRILEFWAMEYHVDGFQIMTEKENISLIEQSPILADTKLIFRAFEEDKKIGKKVNKAESVAKRACINQNDVMRDFRCFLKGDDYTLDAFLYHFTKNDKTKAYMNAIADYHGFRLSDLVSYNEKHNEANGEENADGTEENFSWNCGVEGPTDNSGILALRKQQMKNALSFVLLGQGTPYLFMGDEMGCSQQGNNNPYNQDNDISWLNWNCLKEQNDIYQYSKALIAYRKANKMLHWDAPLDGRDYSGIGYPNISFHGREAYFVDTKSNGKEVGIMLGENKLIYIACNMQWIGRKLAMPSLKDGVEWKVVMKTCVEEPFLIKEKRLMDVPPRSVVVLEAEPEKTDEAKAKHITAF